MNTQLGGFNQVLVLYNCTDPQLRNFLRITFFNHYMIIALSSHNHSFNLCYENNLFVKFYSADPKGT